MPFFYFCGGGGEGWAFDFIPGRLFGLIADVPEGPTAILLDANILPENSPPGTLVGNLIVHDQDENEAPTCTILNDSSKKVGPLEQRTTTSHGKKTPVM